MPNTSAAFVGWFRRGRGRWERVVEGVDEADTWIKLHAHVERLPPGPRDLYVGAAGRLPPGYRPPAQEELFPVPPCSYLEEKR